jgi:hypothetical protein
MAEGRITFDDTPYRTLVARCQAAGMPGPHVCSFTGSPRGSASDWAWNATCPRRLAGRTQEGGDGRRARAIVETTKAPGAVVFLWCETSPRREHLRPSKYQCWHPPGAHLRHLLQHQLPEKASEFSPPPALFPGCFRGGAGARGREACAKSGRSSGGTARALLEPVSAESACFQPLRAGLFFWKTGAKSQVNVDLQPPPRGPVQRL